MFNLRILNPATAFVAAAWIAAACATPVSAVCDGPAATFDTDLEGWTVDGDNTFFWNATDGNPGGCLEVQDDAAGPWSRATAPPEYLGSWAAFTAADSLIYEAIHIPSATQPGNPPYIFRIEGPGGAAQWDPPGFPANTWNRFAAPIDSTQWNVVAGEWSNIVANVGKLLVAVEMISGSETVRIDNVCLTGLPSGSLYRECEVANFELGTPGWTSQDATLAAVGSDGDGGSDYMRVTQTDPAGRVIAPDWWSGDWSGLDGDGTISFLFTFLGNTVEPGRQIRLELSGPGGAAFVSASTDGYALPNRLWIPFSWPLAAGSWTVTSGTWAGLLADVTELAVSCDYATGNDVFGLDSFRRVASTCDPPAGSPLVFHEPNYSECGPGWRFRDPSTLAINPADGQLYVLTDQSVSAGGGVYALEGPAVGGRLQSFATPNGLVFTADGDGFVTDNNAGNLYRFVGADSQMVWASEFAAGDDDPAGLIVAPPGFEGPNVTAGDLLVTDHGNSGPDQIWAVSPDSANGERVLVGDPGTVDWYDLATDGTTVWACDSSDDDVLWIIQPDGTTSQLPLSENVTNKRAFAYDAGQDFLYTLRTTSPLGLYRIDPSDGQVTLIADGFGAFGTANLEIDEDARKLWVADEGQAFVYEICLPPASAVAAGSLDLVPSVLSLSLRPNPIVQGTRIMLDLPRATHVRVDIVDLAGRRVRTFEDGALPAGTAVLPWDGRDGRGRRVAAGVYFIRMQADGDVRTKKAVVLR